MTSALEVISLAYEYNIDIDAVILIQAQVNDLSYIHMFTHMNLWTLALHL